MKDTEKYANIVSLVLEPNPTSDRANRIRLVPFDEIKLSPHRRDLVKGIIPRVGISLVWGKPKCGKSFWLFDMIMHVALGWQYRGRRVHQGPVVYCCFEGQTGFEARVEAFRLHRLANFLDPVPFYLMPVTLDLVKDHQALMKAIRDKLGDDAPVAVGLDTLNRSIGGSESSDQDMSAYIRAADAIREAFECAIPIVHHCGHEGTRPRGHSSMSGAIDAQIQVSRDAANRIIAEVELAKDGPQGTQIVSSLEIVTVGVDEDGDEITSCVVKPEDGTAASRSFGNWPKGLKLVHEAITAALLDHGTEHRVSGDGPAVRAVNVLEARRAHLQRFVSSGEGDRDAAERQAWSRNFKTARNNGLIAGEKANNLELIWLIRVRL